MLAAQSPATGDQKALPKSGRKPLQPKNAPATPTNQIDKTNPKPKQGQEWLEISLIGDSNKENHPVYATPPTKIIEPFDTSLAEELSAIRKKLERLRLERERTEKMLKERDMVLDMQIKELEQRGEIQKNLEMEVDRLFRLKELKSYCMRISPIRSLREKEQQNKMIGEAHLQDLRAADAEESVGENSFPSPSSDSSEVAQK